MKKVGLLGWVFMLLALFGAFVLLAWGRILRAAWYAMGSDPVSKAQAADLEAAVAKVEAAESKKGAAAAAK